MPLTMLGRAFRFWWMIGVLAALCAPPAARATGMIRRGSRSSSRKSARYW